MKMKTVGMLVGLASMALSWYLYDWTLTVVITMAIWGNNLERTGK